MVRRSQRHVYDIHGEDVNGSYGYQLRATPESINQAHVFNQDITLTLLTDDGAPVSGVLISATSSDVGVATVTASDTTDANGQATITVSSVAAGSCVVRFSYPGDGRPTVGHIPVTVVSS